MLLDMNNLKENFYKTNMFVNKFVITHSNNHETQ